jgi:hypothetical protein
MAPHRGQLGVSERGILMAYGEPARQLFGSELVDRLAAAAASDASQHITQGEYLAASFSAAHHVRLTGERPWGDDAQQLMADQLKVEIDDDLKGARDDSAASRAATYQMLTGAVPWQGEELERMYRALKDVPETPGAYGELVIVDQVADYLVLGGEVFWTEDEYQEMRRAAIVDFQHRMDAKEEALAADRLAFIDVLQQGIEALARTGI